MKKIFIVLIAALIPSLVFASPRTGTRTKKDKAKVYQRVKLNPDRTVVLRGPIDPTTVLPVVDEIRMLDEEMKSDIFLIIRSGGGRVDSGLDVIATIEAVDSRVICVIDTEAYSMAALIATRCNRLYIHRFASMMFHEASFGLGGNESLVKSRIEFILSSLEDLHIDTAKVLNMPLEEYKDKIRKEWWMKAFDSVKEGVADGVIIDLLYDWTPPPPPPPFIFPLSGGEYDNGLDIEMIK